jgi:hypothetical protein
MLLLSRADLLSPRDRERMAGYIREQIRRELEPNLAVHPVSIVGADESLLLRWFEENLTPLLEQHRALVEASLNRNQRSTAARQVVGKLQDVSATTIESLRRFSPLADADVASVRDFHAGGLPTPNIDRLRAISFIPQPWWARIAPPLAARSTEHAVRRRAGYELRDVVRFHDRQIQSWLKTDVVGIVELYDAQATVFREQIRRLGAESTDAGKAEGGAELESDLRELRREETNAALFSERPGIARAT